MRPGFLAVGVFSFNTLFFCRNGFNMRSRCASREAAGASIVATPVESHARGFPNAYGVNFVYLDDAPPRSCTSSWLSNACGALSAQPMRLRSSSLRQPKAMPIPTELPGPYVRGGNVVTTGWSSRWFPAPLFCGLCFPDKSLLNVNSTSNRLRILFVVVFVLSLTHATSTDNRHHRHARFG